MESVWNTYLEKHFPEERWKNYYPTIMYYTISVNLGLKPSFMWDFGPRPTNADQITRFIQDLKQNNIISNDTLVVLLRCRVFVANVPNLIYALEDNSLVIDITESTESGWFLGYKNDFIITVSDYIVDRLAMGNFHNGRVNFDFERHFPTVYGLMLGYPFTYYTEQRYPPISFYLHFYRVICKYRFGDTSEDFPIYVFSIPRSLVTPVVRTAVNSWFQKLRSRNNTGFRLVLEEWEEYFDAPDYGRR